MFNSNPVSLMRVFLVAKTDSQKVFHSVCYADVAHLNHAHDRDWETGFELNMMLI